MAEPEKTHHSQGALGLSLATSSPVPSVHKTHHKPSIRRKDVLPAWSLLTCPIVDPVCATLCVLLDSGIYRSDSYLIMPTLSPSAIADWVPAKGASKLHMCDSPSASHMQVAGQ